VWQETVAAITSTIAAAGVIGGGLWAYFRFVKEAPDWTRADPQIKAQLFTVDGRDVLRVDVSVSAIGHARITFVRDGPLEPAVFVYRFTSEMLDTLEPAEWTEVLIGQGVLRDQEFVEAGETVGSSHLLPLGVRQGDTLAYRVEFIFKAHDPSLQKDFTWGATDCVPVRILPFEPGGVGNGIPNQHQ
jgi:hypothetical protein